MRFRIEYSQDSGGPFEPLLEISASSWQVAEFDLFETSEGLLPFGYYRVHDQGDRACTLYFWDGRVGSFSLLQTTLD